MEDIFSILAFAWSGVTGLGLIVGIALNLRKWKKESPREERLKQIEMTIDKHTIELAEIREDVQINTDDRKVTLSSLLAILRHLRTGNNTGHMDSTIQALEEHLVKSR